MISRDQMNALELNIKKYVEIRSQNELPTDCPPKKIVGFKPTAFIALGEEVLWHPRLQHVTLGQLIRFAAISLSERTIGAKMTFGRNDPYINGLIEKKITSRTVVSSKLRMEDLQRYHCYAEQLSFVRQHLIALKSSGFSYDRDFEEEVIQFILILDTIERSPHLSTPQSKEMQSFRQSFIYLLDKTLNFDISREIISYGSGKKFSLTSIWEESSGVRNTIHTFMTELAESPDCFSLVLERTLEHWAFVAKINSKGIPRLVDNKTLITPGPTNTSPLGLVSTLGLHSDVVKLVIRKCKTLPELFLMGNLLLSLLDDNIYSITNNKPNAQGFINGVSIFIDEYLHSRIPAGNIQSWYEENYHKNKGVDVTNLKLYSFFEETVKETCNCLQNIPKASSFLTKEYRTVLGTAVPFSLKSLIHSFFQQPKLEECLKEGRLSDAVEDIVKTKGNIDLNRIKQCVESTTSRSYINAVLIEWLQNAVDINRQYPKRNKEIGFGVWTVNHTHLCLSIYDHIGFPTLATLLEFLIPDHSRKSKLKGVELVGQLGNGLFKMYQKAQQVTVTTRVLSDPQKVYFVSIIPIREEVTKQVEDLQIRCVEITKLVEEKNSNFRGTEINLMMLPQSQETLLADYLFTQKYIVDTIGSAQLEKDGIELYLRSFDKTHQRINLCQYETMLYESKDDKTVTVSTLSSEENPSLVTIQGIPYQSLTTFCERYSLLPINFATEMAYGIVVDIPEGFCKPVQSRTELKISDDCVGHLRQALSTAYYQRTLTKNDYKCFLFSDVAGTIDTLHDHAIHPYLNMMKDYTKACLEKREFSKEIFMTYYEPAIMEFLSPYKSFAELIQKYVFEVKTHYDSNLKMKINKGFESLKSVILAEIQIIGMSEFRKIEVVQGLLERVEKWKAQLESECKAVLENQSINDMENEKIKSLITKGVIPWILMKIQPGGFPIMDKESIFFKIAELRPLNYKPSRIVETVPTTSQFEKDNMFRSLYQEGLKVLKSCLEDYCKLYLKLSGIKHKTPSIKFIANMTSSSIASYNSTENEICINLATEKSYTLFALMAEATQDNLDTMMKAMEGWFLPSRTESGCINHELEHLLLHHNGCNGGHGLTTDLKGNQVSFEASAITTANEAIKEKLFEQWLQNVKTRIQQEIGDTASQLFYDIVKWFEDKEMKSWLLKPDSNINGNFKREKFTGSAIPAIESFLHGAHGAHREKFEKFNIYFRKS